MLARFGPAPVSESSARAHRQSAERACHTLGALVATRVGEDLVFDSNGDGMLLAGPKGLVQRDIAAHPPLREVDLVRLDVLPVATVLDLLFVFEARIDAAVRPKRNSGAIPRCRPAAEVRWWLPGPPRSINRARLHSELAKCHFLRLRP